MALPAPRPGWIPPNAARVLGPRPGVHSEAYTMMPVKLNSCKTQYRFPCETVDIVLPETLRHVYSVQVGPMQLYTQLTQSKVQKISIL